ncbi:kinesin-like protein KIF21A isoform X2 [Oppia nitens]|uniref:kinesin-like protein KIF21A isoform X2 n=1 Tax=Oppia nitens TaxID=1686743 RepID=UPI0023DC8B50|nr:kinesin-like protein KIF21A isoform X2 [Oppia nitens]
MMELENNVKVAIRIRPQLPKEVIDMCKTCTRVTPNEPQVWLGADKAFTYDHVFDINSQQQIVYEECVKKLINGCFEGYNATVLAYGQTGSGKTYTMGTGFDIGSATYEKGIIPRAIEHLFLGIADLQQEARDRREPIPEFKVNAQFLELYNEDIIDLLADERSKHSHIKIHEDSNGGIYINGVNTKPVQTIDETLQCLKMGALSRTTASTQMNAQSSRSHAIFTLHIKQHRVTPIDQLLGDEINEQMNTDLGPQEFETLTAKFHFVDLAGSERLKRTGATGERAREGISINSGLLALGNVISALGDKAKKATHVPYRDSKLTRLLQDSLGGNSMTLMIACVSPSDRDFMETLNTLRYANRAKNIKNKVTANQDKSSQTITALRREIQELQIELQEYKQGKRLIDNDGTEKINDMYHENNMLMNELQNLKVRVKALQETNERLITRNAEVLADKEVEKWINNVDGKGDKSNISSLVNEYMKEIEDLRTKLIEMEETCSLLRKQTQRNGQRMSMSPFHCVGAVAMTGNYDIGMNDEKTANDVINEAKRDVEKIKKLSKLRKRSILKDSIPDTNGNDIELNGLNDDNEDEELSDEELDDNDSSEESDDESQKAQQEIDETEKALMALTSEIDLKEKLIIELEKSQKKMSSMRQHYEDKLLQLQNRITETESERDNVLAKLNTLGNKGDDKAKKVREEYQKKLNNLQTEMKKLQTAKREHSQALRNHNVNEAQMRQLRNEVMEMKKQKVKIIAKMKEETQKHREAEIRQNKKISQLSKQDRQKAIKIKTLEVESNRMKNLLKRKDEECIALKRRVNPMSDRVAGRIANSRRGRNLPYSPVAAKMKWQRLESEINKISLSKSSVSVHEKAMERYINQRQQLSRSLDKANRKYESALRTGKHENEIRVLQEEIETIEANLKYINENIDDMQSTIVQIEDAEGDLGDIQQYIQYLNIDEMKYMFNKVFAMAINQSMLATQKEEEKKELEMKYKQIADSSLIQEQLLHHVLDNTFIDNANNQVVEDNNKLDEDIDNQMPIPYEFEHHFKIPSSPQPVRTSTPSKEKFRRITRTPIELLGDPCNTTVLDHKNNCNNDVMTQSLIAPNIITEETELPRIPSAPSLKELSNESTTPPASPSVQRRNRDAIENVFSRLTNGTITNNQINIDRAGNIVPFTGRSDKSAPLICTHTAEGHTRPVLSVVATNDVLFSGSKDCSLKVWDLQTGQEILSINDHPDSVQVVRYNEYNRLAFSASKSFIKVWDPRDSPARCIKTLNSSGLVSQNVSANLNATKLELAPGEAPILDVQLSTYGTTLFSTCSRIVRVWDLRMFHCIGKLNTGHKADIMCMAVEEAGVDNNLVITGSKDHYIKVFEMQEGVGGIHNPKMSLKPPHYDGIEALKICGDFLFSGSRDACIKKWDLQSQRLVHSLNNCHKDWVLSLNTMPNSNILLSGCRSGQLKIWSTENCHNISELKAHSNAINSIDTNSSLVFTASSDNTINLWRWRSNYDPSPEYIDCLNE